VASETNCHPTSYPHHHSLSSDILFHRSYLNVFHSRAPRNNCYLGRVRSPRLWWWWWGGGGRRRPCM